jgi:glycosyltransferase involved in cell wall biosynthesis
MEKDLVSIVVPTYNDEQYLRQSLQDIANQTYENIEVVIVNDGSTDNTEDILKEYCDKYKNMRYYNKDNGGTGTALNLGFSKAKGEFGTWFSSDDSKSPDMIEKLVTALKQNRDIEYAVSAYKSEYVGKVKKQHTQGEDKSFDIRPYVEAENGHGFRHKWFGDYHDGEYTNKVFHVDDWIEIEREQNYQGVNFMFTMRLKNECGDFLTIPGEDYHMAVKMGLNSRLAYLDSCLGVHKDPPDALSNQNRACVVGANIATANLIGSEHKTWHLKKIPKIAHFYWGSDKMSFLRYMTLHSFKKANPDWSVVLYTPKDLEKSSNWYDKNHRCDVEDYEGAKDYFEMAKELPIKVVEVDFEKIFGDTEVSEVHKSDYFRWYLLHHYGGMWSDMDVLFIKSMKDMKMNSYENAALDCSINVSPAHGSRIGILLSSKNRNPFYGKLMTESKKILLSGEKLLYQSVGPVMINKLMSPAGSSEISNIPGSGLKLNFRNSSGEVVPLKHEGIACSEFYLYDHQNIDSIFEKDCYSEASERSIAIHWYGGSPITQKVNNSMTMENYKNFNSTISKCIEKVLEK